MKTALTYGLLQWLVSALVFATPFGTVNTAVATPLPASPSSSCNAPLTYQCGRAPAYADVAYGTAPNTVHPTQPPVTLRLDIYEPQAFGVVPRGPAVIFIHGGGFITGDKSDLQTVWISNDLAANGYLVYNMDYRLAPCPVGKICASAYSDTGRYLDPLDDVRTAVRWAKGINPSLGGAATVGLVGGSAGGTLADLAALTGAANRATVVTAISLSGPAEIRFDHMIDPATGLTPTDSSPIGQEVSNFIGCPFWRTTSPSACPERYAAMSATAQAIPSAPPILQAIATQDHAAGLPIFDSGKELQAALVADSDATAFDVPSATTCHAYACWDTRSATTGRYIAADSVLWLRRFLG